MREKLVNVLNRLKQLWQRLTKKQKIWIIGGLAAVLIITTLLLILTNIDRYEPLYSDLSATEAGQIADNLDAQNIPYKLADGGTTINVPSDQVDKLKVELAAQGIPKTGQIDYSFFGQNAGFGMTDKQFDVLQRAAMQTELANLISNTEGVQSAKVMITLPQNDAFVGDQDKKSEASASIVMNVEPQFQLSENQINGLYHLVSRSVPNLPEDNIVIMDQYYNYYDKKKSGTDDSTLSAFQQQQEIVHEIESGLARRVSQMLNTMMGQGKAMVNVTADVDFTKQQEKQDLVEPVDPETMEGLQTSSEQITETYTGEGAAGQAGTGENDVPTYQAGENGNGTYKKVEERVNNEFNRIHREITNSPYKVTDLGIQVMVEPPDANDPASLPQQRVDDVKAILNSIVQTSVSDTQGQELPQNVIDQKTLVTVGQFNGKDNTPNQPQTNYWPYLIAAGVAVLAGVLLLLAVLRRRKREAAETETVVEDIPQPQDELEEAMTKENPEQKKYKEVEKLAKQQPDQFVKLLRSWLADEK